MSDVTKEEALQAITTVYRYALSLGNSHPFARDIEVWMIRHWAMSGTMAVQSVKREKNAKAKIAGPVNTTDQPNRVKFVHPKSQQAQAVEAEPEPAFQSPLQQIAAPSGEGQDSPRRGRKPKAQAEHHPTAPDQEGGESPVAAAEPLTTAELSEIKGMALPGILSKFGESRLSATLKVLKIEHAELSGSQKAAAVKANAGK